MERGTSKEVKAMKSGLGGGLLGTQEHVDVWVWAAVEGHIFSHGPVAAMLCVNILGS